MPKGVYLHKPLSKACKIKIGKSISVANSHRKGCTYEQIFGAEIAKAMREKQSLAHEGKTFHWGKEHPKGANHPRWIRDRTQVKNRRKDVLSKPRYTQWRTAVFKRDDFKCRTGNECHGQLEAHHILPWRDYPELRYKVNNGITLCRVHHPRRWTEEKRLEPIFKELVTVSKKN